MRGAWSRAVRRDPESWWAWLATALALGAGLVGWRPGIPLAMAAVAVQAVVLRARARSVRAFPVQVRLAYLALLLLGCWPPLRFVHAAQLAGTATLLVFDYCPLARLLSLLPWNRRGRLTLARVRATFLTPPVAGSILGTLDTGTGARR
jgi:hypothetical protein